ncbi:MAG: metallophosphoesterase [Bacteroidota bacterium]
MGRDLQLLIILSVFLLYLYLKINGIIKQLLPEKYKLPLRLTVWGGMGVLVGIYIIRAYNPFGLRHMMPDAFYYPLWFALVYMVQTVPYLLLIDLLILPLYSIYKKNKPSYRSIRAKVLMAIMGFFLLYVPLRMWYDDSNVRVLEMSYEKEQLARDLEDLKIVLIADIQLDAYTTEEEVLNYLNKVNDLEPDLVLLAGDYITGTPNYIDPIGKLLPTLKAKYGVIGCAGDHDHWAYRGGDWGKNQARSIREVKESLESGGIPLLIDENRDIRIGESVIKLTSTNQTYAADISNEVLDSLTLDTTDYDLKIFLNHQPKTRLVKKASATGYDFFLAGHTHGGQVKFLFPFFSFTTAGLGQDSGYIKGEYRYEDMLIAVCSGLGMSIAPIRYNCTPDIVLIRLKAS